MALDVGGGLNVAMPTPQASTLASATGGNYYGAISASNIAATMISSISTVTVNIQAVVTVCCLILIPSYLVDACV